MKQKAYICFDYDNDFELKECLVGQAKNPDSPFEISDISIKQEIESKWKDAARRKISQADVVIVICGKHTDTAKGVAAELSITQEEGKPYFLLQGRKDGNVKKPANASRTDKIYNWTWNNLKLLIKGAR
ncbi:MAG: TIR domain-containing protein [Clostridia bacterium]|nr:TIR domain-containing protein [Clostridia bacterium]